MSRVECHTNSVGGFFEDENRLASQEAQDTSLTSQVFCTRARKAASDYICRRKPDIHGAGP